MKKSIPLILALTFASLSIGFSQNYYGVNSPNAYETATLYTIDPSDATVFIETIDITMGAADLVGSNGLAYNPVENEIYIITREGAARTLATLDPITGVATLIGTLSNNFAGITFDSDGTLYGVTGEGGITPSAIFTINVADASSSLLIDVDGGSDGETIAFNSTDGLIYRYGGGTLWQTINPETLEVIDGNLTGTVTNASHGLTYRAETNDFLFCAGFDFYSVTTGGDLTLLSSGTIGYKGIVAESSITALKEKYQAASHIQVFPNPASDAVNIQLEKLVNELSVEVYQADGQLVRTMKLSGVNQVSINLDGLPGGLYNIAIQEDGKRFVKRFVKK